MNYMDLTDCCPQKSPKIYSLRPLNLITHSLTIHSLTRWPILHFHTLPRVISDMHNHYIPKEIKDSDEESPVISFFQPELDPVDFPNLMPLWLDVLFMGFILSSYLGYFCEPHWKSKVTSQVWEAVIKPFIWLFLEWGDPEQNGPTSNRNCSLVFLYKFFYRRSHNMGIWYHMLTHWGRVTHICIGKLVIIGSNNGLSPDRRQAIIWTNAGLMSIGPMRTYFSENLIKIQQFSLKKLHVKMSSAKWRPSCLSLNVLKVMRCLCLPVSLIKQCFLFFTGEWHTALQISWTFVPICNLATDWNIAWCYYEFDCSGLNVAKGLSDTWLIFPIFHKY